MIRFLIVEDCPVDRLMEKDALIEAFPGCEVIEAFDGINGLDVLIDELQVNGRKIDLVLTDLVMTREGGIFLKKQINAHWPYLRVVMLSTNDFSEDPKHEVHSLGFAGFMVKKRCASKDDQAAFAAEVAALL